MAARFTHLPDRAAKGSLDMIKWASRRRVGKSGVPGGDGQTEIKNKYKGTCKICRESVPAGKGRVRPVRNATPEVVCYRCFQHY